MIEMVIGHLVGDFMLQPKKMALKKSSSSLICTIHVLIYTLSVMFFLWSADLVMALAIAIPHWIIDRYSMATYWIWLIKSRDFESAAWTSRNSMHKFRDFDVAFTAIVYTVTDGTLHLICLFLAFTYLS